MSVPTLSIKSIPAISAGTCRTQDYKQRIDPALVRMVQESIQRRSPHLKVGKRVALEFVLLDYLGRQGLLNDAPLIPGLADRDPLTE